MGEWVKGRMKWKCSCQHPETPAKSRWYSQSRIPHKWIHISTKACECAPWLALVYFLQSAGQRRLAGVCWGQRGKGLSLISLVISASHHWEIQSAGTKATTLAFTHHSDSRTLPLSASLSLHISGSQSMVSRPLYQHPLETFRKANPRSHTP